MIRDLALSNFKCFESLSVDLYPLTILCGTNSTGKSSVLQSLLLLHQSYQTKRLQAGGLTLNGEFVQLGVPESILTEDAESRTIELAVGWSDATQANFRFSLPMAERPVWSASVLPPMTTLEAKPPFSQCGFISADRVGPRVAFAFSPELEDGDTYTVGTHGDLVAHYLAKFGPEPIPNQLLHHQSAASTRLLDELVAWLEPLAHDTQVLADLFPQLEIAALSFSFPGKHGRTKQQRSTHVGFGLTHVLPVLTMVLSCPAGGLLLIENPEAHLHPRAQRHVAAMLAKAAAAGIQVIVETHSDHILNGARVAVKTHAIKAEDVGIHYFSTDRVSFERHVTSPRILEDGSISEWPDGFFDEWDKALDDLLQR